MRVLHISPAYAPAYIYGGPVYAAEQLVAELATLGVEQRVLTTDANGLGTLPVPSGWSDRNGVPTRYLHRWLRPDVTFQSLPEAYKLARWADAVHVSGLFCTPSALGLVAAAAARKPAFLSVCGALQPPAMAVHSLRKRAWLRGLASVYKTVHTFHATASPEAREIRKVFGEGRRVAIIPNGAAPISDEAVYSLRGEAPCDGLTIGMVLRVHPIKAIDRALEALALLHRSGLKARLVVAGPAEDPRYREQLTKQARELELTGFFELCGPVYGHDKLRFYARSAVLLVASHSENFSNVVVEALNVQTPVVASRGSPWAELNECGCGAWVANDPESLAEGLRPFLMDADLRRRAGESGRQLVARKYTWPQVARETLCVYEETLSSSRPSRSGASRDP